MKLYRFAGQAERWIGCGRLPITRTVSANLTELKKFSNKWRADARKDNKEHKVYIEIIHIETINAALIAKALSNEDTEVLVKLSGVLKEWEWTREDEETTS